VSLTLIAGLRGRVHFIIYVSLILLTLVSSFPDVAGVWRVRYGRQLDRPVRGCPHGMLTMERGRLATLPAPQLGRGPW
jgi:hypothetical protein